jgi:hypothetical protein
VLYSFVVVEFLIVPVCGTRLSVVRSIVRVSWVE